MHSHVFPPLRRGQAIDPVLARRALALFVGAHGLAHIVGTTHAFSRAADGRSLDYLTGSWTISNPTTLRAVGVLWAVMALGFVASGAAIWADRPRWPLVLWCVSLVSLVLVLLAVWASVVGVFVDLALLAVAWRAGALQSRRSPHLPPL